MTYEELINKINRAKEDYYQSGRSELTDAEYDKLVSQAEKLGYIESVGAAPVKEIPTIRHEHPMLSLDKCHTIKDVEKFAGDKAIVAMYKADGLSVSATYEDGILTRLETRGNGDVGNNIMFHANSFENLPKHINKNGKYVIDGECVILWSDFAVINDRLVDSEKYSHARNLAAGSLNQLDPNISKKRHLRFYAWDVIEGGENNSLYHNLLNAIDLGFDVVGLLCISEETGDNIEDDINYLKMLAENTSFPIDGIVFKFDDVSYGKSLGRTGHHFRNGIAYKFTDNTYPTKLKEVVWQCGKSGQLTPVAIFDPVDMSGTIVEKASVHNVSIIKQLGLTNGCTCYIKRANDVIPQIDYVDPDGDGEIEITKFCPVCGAPTRVIKENESEVLYCTNDNCPGILLGKYKTFVSKQGFDIDGLSVETLRKFLKLGYLTNMFVSIYELGEYKKELYKLDGFGKRSIDKLLGAIEASKSVDLQHFLCAFSIDGIGTGQSKLLANKFKTFDEFAAACDNGYNFSQISGIGPVLNAAIHKWWVNNHQQMMDVAELVHFITDDFMNPPTGINSPVNGKTFCITGSVAHYKNRDELKEEIERLGGKVSGSVSKKTDYLINNDTESTSGKNKKAQELGVQIISEDEYIKLRGPI